MDRRKKTKVVNRRKTRVFDVYIGRPTKWGNPFSIGKDGTREEVVEKYREWIKNQPELLASLHELKGKVLACWCSPLACHGEVLAEMAEESDGGEQKNTGRNQKA